MTASIARCPSWGGCVVEDDVEIGANTTIDRGGLGDTRIGAGTKIDNLVMVAHNVDLGTGCLLAGQAGIAGSSRLGDGVVLAGQAGASGHLRIAGGTAVGAKSAVLSDVNEKGFITGIPAFDHREWLRVQAALRKLPDLLREVRALRRRVEELEEELSRTRDEEQS